MGEKEKREEEDGGEEGELVKLTFSDERVLVAVPHSRLNLHLQNFLLQNIPNTRQSHDRHMTVNNIPYTLPVPTVYNRRCFKQNTYFTFGHSSQTCCGDI